MCSSVFSDFKTNGINSAATFSSSAQNSVMQYRSDNSKKKSGKTKDLISHTVPISIPLAGIPLAALITYRISTRNLAGLSSQIIDMSKEINELKSMPKIIQQQNQKTDSGNVKLWAAIAGAAGLAGAYQTTSLTKGEEDKLMHKLKDRVDKIDTTSHYALQEAQKTSAGASTLINKYTKDINGVQLLDNPTTLTKDKNKYNNAVHFIQNAASMKLYDTPHIQPITGEHPTLWSVTSEFAPIKEGGLGCVPVAIQENFTNLGIDNPAFIPMYQQKGKATLRKEGENYIYKYGKDMEVPVKKAAAFQMDVFRNGISSTENVEVFVANMEKDENKPPRQLVFIKNDNYFDGSIYQGGARNEEPEKFAFFSKAVYEFAKMKSDINSVKNSEIPDKQLFDSIKAPEGFILNDWQASPIAALTRYKAPMENAFGQLDNETANKLSQMTIITIGHNTMYQGSTLNNNDSKQSKEATSNILNTLFDNYTYDIVSNAKTNASIYDKEDDNLKNIDNVLLTDKDYSNLIHTNLLNMGVCLSDYFHPVSQNYANEIISKEHDDLAGELKWALTRRNETGSLVGIINGNDFNKLSIEAKKGKIKETSGLDFETYNKNTDIDDVIKARTENKIKFYNEFIKPFTKKNDASITDANIENIRKISEDLEFVECADKIKKLPDLTHDELENTPVLTSVGRLVSQKGVNVMCDAIELLMKNWDKDFGNRPKPIFYIGGRDGEDGQQRAFVEKLQNEQLSKEDSNRVVFMHGMAPMQSLTAASDFFLLPSNFEPCGLTQSESFALGTPVIGSSVGGIVDTVNRNGFNNGILTKHEPKLTAQSFYEAMKKGLNIYFNDKEKYKNMVNDSLQEDFSWVQKCKQGPVFEYLSKMGVDTNKLPDIA